MKWAFLFPHDVFCLCLLSHTGFHTLPYSSPFPAALYILYNTNTRLNDKRTPLQLTRKDGRGKKETKHRGTHGWILATGAVHRPSLLPSVLSADRQHALFGCRHAVNSDQIQR